MRQDLEAKRREYIHLAKLEKWEIIKDPVDGSDKIIADDQEFPLVHPYQIHLKLYKEGTTPQQKLQHMIKVHHLLWPQHIQTWNYWIERIFTAHCEGWKKIVLAAGSSAGKSIGVAKMSSIFWLANPERTAVLVASTTLDSVESRIWGYVIKLFRQSAINIPYNLMQGKPQKIMYPGQADKINGMFATAVKQGEDNKVINNLIGRHPEDGLIMVFDEATDMPPAVVTSLPNLEDVPFFQLWAIGNSSSKTDLHGALATPRVGWKNIDPNKDWAWETVHPGGICLYFNPHDSPAIKDPDPKKRAILGKFLMSEEKLAKKIADYGTDSDAYYRFVLGFWRRIEQAESAMSTMFLAEHQIDKTAEWLGINPLYMIAGLDPAFRQSSRGCVMQLAIWGQSVTGKLMLDFRNEDLLFRLNITHVSPDSPELQVADQVRDILIKYRIPLNLLAIDITGAGRVLPELIRIRYQKKMKELGREDSGEYPLKVVSGGKISSRTRVATINQDNIIAVTPTDMWMSFKEFVQQDHIRGLGPIAVQQISNRKLVMKDDNLILEQKDDYVNRMRAIDPKLAHSPDEADAVILAMMSAIHRLGFTPGMSWGIPDLQALDAHQQQKMVAYMEMRKTEFEILRSNSVRERHPLEANFAGTLEEQVENMVAVRPRIS